MSDYNKEDRALILSLAELNTLTEAMKKIMKVEGSFNFEFNNLILRKISRVFEGNPNCSEEQYYSNLEDENRYQERVKNQKNMDFA